MVNNIGRRMICGDAAESIEANEIQNLTKFVDGRLVDLLSSQRAYVNKRGKNERICVVYQACICLKPVNIKL